MLDLTANDTIAAQATPPGAGPRGIIRISGPQTAQVLERVLQPWPGFESSLQTRVPVVFPAQFSLGEERHVRVDVLFWPTSAAFTRQPSAEIHLVGSPPVMEMALRMLCRQGCRLASPGEFTFRAFLGGRIDLIQAEAVLATIEAQDERQFRMAIEQLAGGLSHPLLQLRNTLLDLLADVEAGLDFVEDDLSFVTSDSVIEVLSRANGQLNELLDQLQERGQARRSPRVVLLGPPNAGKSSLFNCLAGSRLAIVSPERGTTRDYLSIQLEFCGQPLELVDTAGIDSEENRRSDDQLLHAAMQSLAHRQQSSADLRVYCHPADSALPWEPVLGMGSFPPVLWVITKSDLLPQIPVESTAIHVSSETGVGIERLQKLIIAQLQDTKQNGGYDTVSSQRCAEALQSAIQAMDAALDSARAGMSDEMVATDLRVALDAIGQIVGVVHNEDVLDRLFSRFCIGK